MASSEMSSEERPVRCNRSRIKWTKEMNNTLLDCKSKAQALVKSENPPRLENGRKNGYMRVMKELWDEAGFENLALTSQNLRDQAARLEKSIGDVGYLIAASVGLRTSEEADGSEGSTSEVNVCNVQATNFVINQHENADLHTVADETSLEGQGSKLSQDTRDLIDSSNLFLARVNISPGEFGEREFDTRIKERPTKRDLDNINQTITEIMKQASPWENPFSYLWIANCVLYSVVVAFLLNKGWKKQRSGTPAGGASKQQEWKRVYEKREVEVRKKISIAQAELEHIKENRKITKKGKRNRAVLEKECKGLSATKLVSFMEKQKAILRKLKRGFSRSQKNEEARILNQQFQADTSKVYANMRELLDKDKENERPRYTTSDQNTQEDKEMFNNVEEASEYWRNLWESEGTGDRCASWLEEIRSAIQRRVPPPTEEDWDLHPAVAAKVLAKKKNRRAQIA